MITLIAAVSEDGYIGKDGKIPWHIPEDLKRFKNLTKGHTVVMGRKTWESLPIRPLPERENYVLTRNPNYVAEGAKIATSINEILENLNDFYVIGGEQVYRDFIKIADKLEITKVYQTINGDARFPEIGKEWEEFKREEKEGYTFITYVRRYE